jgi:hypothetical protein
MGMKYNYKTNTVNIDILLTTDSITKITFHYSLYIYIYLYEHLKGI